MRTGRPSIYTDEIAEEICERLELGQSLSQIVKADDMPHRVTVYRWRLENVEFRNQYALARTIQAEHYFDEVLDIAFKPQHDNVQVQRARHQTDNLKWVLGRMDRSKYGDKASLDIETPKGVQVNTTVDVPDELREPLQKLMQKHARRKE